MLLSILWVQVRLAFSILPDRAQDGIDTVAALILFMCLWLVWRLWRFTILPCIYSDDPDELPYWIPSKLFDFQTLLLCCPFEFVVVKNR